ncbi:Uncharacterised protein [Burkholderia pseudomallei]|nr:Uncharacterised protein [Burkholderia pseudomallei]
MICAMRCARSAAVSRVLIASGSASVCSTVLRGLSEANGFWNTICTRRRSAATVSRSAPATSRPSIDRCPALGGSIIVSCRASVDLPQPDSPTTASVLPRARENDTPFSAFTVPWPNIPRRTA